MVLLLQKDVVGVRGTILSNTRIVARSASSTDLLNPYVLSTVGQTLSQLRSDLVKRSGVMLPVIEPEFRLFPDGATIIASELMATKHNDPVDSLRCVIDVKSDTITLHGSTGAPIILIHLSNENSGWRQDSTGSYNAIVEVNAEFVPQLLTDIFLDLMMANSDHIKPILDAFLKTNCFTSLGALKALHIRRNLGEENIYGRTVGAPGYISFCTHSRDRGGQNIERAVQIWETFALSEDLVGLATAELAISSLVSRKKVGGQLDPEAVTQAVREAENGVHVLAIYTPKLRSGRDLGSEVGSAFGIKSPRRNRFSRLSVQNLWTGPYADLRRRLFNENYVHLERFIINQ